MKADILFTQRLMGYEDIDSSMIDSYHTEMEGYILCLKDLGLVTDREYFDYLDQNDRAYDNAKKAGL